MPTQLMLYLYEVRGVKIFVVEGLLKICEFKRTKLCEEMKNVTTSARGNAKQLAHLLANRLKSTL